MTLLFRNLRTLARPAAAAVVAGMVPLACGPADRAATSPADEADLALLELGRVRDLTTGIMVEVPEPGQRFRGVVREESRESSDGVVFVAGMPVLVPGARPGEHITFEVAEIRGRMGFGALLARHGVDPAVRAGAPEPIDRAPRQGGLYRGTVDGRGRLGDGRVRVGGVPIYVPGTEVGETVTFRITQLRGTHGVGERVDADGDGD